MATGYMGLADYNFVPANSIPGFETGVPGSLGPAAGNDSGSRVQVRIESLGSMIQWYLNGALVHSYDNSGGFYTGGNIFLGATDPFNSVNSEGGTIIDNVAVQDNSVETPEPETTALVAFAALNHPNIVHVYSVEQADGVHCITMELVRGKTLSELPPKEGFSSSRFFDIAIPLADAVAAAHQEGMTHRDLERDNVLVSDGLRVKVLDFGLAKPAVGSWGGMRRASF